MIIILMLIVIDHNHNHNRNRNSGRGRGRGHGHDNNKNLNNVDISTLKSMQIFFTKNGMQMIARIGEEKKQDKINIGNKM